MVQIDHGNRFRTAVPVSHTHNILFHFSANFRFEFQFVIKKFFFRISIATNRCIPSKIEIEIKINRKIQANNKIRPMKIQWKLIKQTNPVICFSLSKLQEIIFFSF